MDRFRNIVVGVDLAGREHLVAGRGLGRYSRAAIAKAVWVAQRNHAHLHMLAALDLDAHAEALVNRAVKSGKPTVLDKAAARLEDIATPARGAGIDVTTEVVIGHPAERLLEDLAENGRDLVVIGTRSRGAVARRILGSTALRMLVRAPVATWIAREGPDHTFETVLAPVDFDEIAPDVLSLAERFADDVGATLHVVHTVDFSAEHVLRAGDADEELIKEYHEQRTAAASERFEELLGGHLKAPEKAVRHLSGGTPADVILELAGRIEADLVVMGTRGDQDTQHRLLGDTAERVLTHLDTSLLVTKPGA